MLTASACKSLGLRFDGLAEKSDTICMLLEIVVENGTAAVGQEEGQDETGEDNGDDAEDDDAEDDDDDDSESESDDDDEMEIGMQRVQALASSGDTDRRSKSLVRPWIEEDDDVRDLLAFLATTSVIITLFCRLVMAI